MPRHLSYELTAANRNLAQHARMRVRLSFSLGLTTPGETGFIGMAPIAVARLSDAALFRQAINEAPHACLGVVIDDHLYHAYVRPDFRPDMSPEAYKLINISDPEKKYKADAWIRLFGGSREGGGL